MKENVSLFDLFPDLDPGAGAEELLKQNTVEDVGLRPKEREVYVCLRSRVYLPLQLLSRTEGIRHSIIPINQRQQEEYA